jgi:hypothetical protein
MENRIFASFWHTGRQEGFLYAIYLACNSSP